MRTTSTLLLIVVVLSLPCCREKPPEPSSIPEASRESGSQEATAPFRSPKELAQAFMDAVFKTPASAYLLFEPAYRHSFSEDQFRSSVKMMLPKADTITSVEFVGSEDGFQESDGVTSSSCSYEVLSSDSFQPKSKVEVDIVTSGDTYWVRRFSVSAMPP